MKEEFEKSLEDVPYTIEVTKEDIFSSLDYIYNNLMVKYHLRDTDFYGFALGPNAYKAFEYAASTNFHLRQNNADETVYRGFKILASPFHGVLPLFKHDGWHCAYEEAKKFLDKSSLQ